MRRSGFEDDRAFKIRAARAAFERARLPADPEFFDRLAVSLMQQCGLSRELAAKRVAMLAISAQPRPRNTFADRGG